MQVREYGREGARVVLVHGGPGAPGYLAPLAEALSDRFQVLEPFQRKSSRETPLSVAQHVGDLRELILSRCHESRPALVGHSWGAMLALAYAAEHPDSVSSIVLIACGTFDSESREQLGETLDQRITPELRTRLWDASEQITDPDQRLKHLGQLLMAPYSHDVVASTLDAECDAQGFFESWEDMLERQKSGEFPRAFEAVRVPVLMLHGADDPHPGRMIHDSLLPHLPHLQYREWQRCGHYPWLERAVREEFVQTLADWLGEHA